MITHDYIPELHRVYLYGLGMCEVKHTIEGTHEIEFDISKEELRDICEKILHQIKLEEMKEKGMAV